MEWNRQKVLVTGAGGFIGSHLTEKLVSLGASTRALIRYKSDQSWGWLKKSVACNDVEIFVGDVRDADSLRSAMKEVDIVFHLAAMIAIPYSYHSPLAYARTNVEGTINVMQQALQAGVKRVVHTSTSEVYGTAQYVPIDEAHPLQGQSPYSASKIGADKMVEAFYRSFDLPVTTVRPFNTYGPRQSARGVLPAIITQVLTKPQLLLGNAKPTRDFCFVSDTVEGFLAAAASEKGFGEVVNLGTGVEISIVEVAKKIQEIVGKSLPTIYEEERLRPELSEVYRLCANAKKAEQLFGWCSKVSLDEGLKQTVAWIEQNLHEYLPGKYLL